MVEETFITANIDFVIALAFLAVLAAWFFKRELRDMLGLEPDEKSPKQRRYKFFVSIFLILSLSSLSAYSAQQTTFGLSGPIPDSVSAVNVTVSENSDCDSPFYSETIGGVGDGELAVTVGNNTAVYGTFESDFNREYFILIKDQDENNLSFEVNGVNSVCWFAQSLGDGQVGNEDINLTAFNELYNQTQNILDVNTTNNILELLSGISNWTTLDIENITNFFFNYNETSIANSYTDTEVDNVNTTITWLQLMPTEGNYSLFHIDNITGFDFNYNQTQNLWATISSDSGSTTADNILDTLSILGGGTISTSILGDILTITGSAHTTDTNATTECADGEYLDGSGGCLNFNNTVSQFGIDVGFNSTFNESYESHNTTNNWLALMPLGGNFTSLYCSNITGSDLDLCNINITIAQFDTNLSLGGDVTGNLNVSGNITIEHLKYRNGTGESISDIGWNGSCHTWEIDGNVVIGIGC